MFAVSCDVLSASDKLCYAYVLHRPTLQLWDIQALQHAEILRTHESVFWTRESISKPTLEDTHHGIKYQCTRVNRDNINLKFIAWAE